MSRQRSVSRLLLVFVILLGFAQLALPGPAAAKPARGRGKAPIELETGRLDTPAAARVASGRPSAKDRYIVVLKDNAGDPLRVAERLATDGVVPTHVYRHVFKGFAALIPPGRLAALKRDPNVASVEPDQVVRPAVEVGPLPTGVDRIDADLSGVAAIDGVDEGSTSTSRCSNPASRPIRTSTSMPRPTAPPTRPRKT